MRQQLLCPMTEQSGQRHSRRGMLRSALTLSSGGHHAALCTFTGIRWNANAVFTFVLILGCMAVQNSGEQVGPVAELDAWQERARRLNSIDAQLTGPGITQVGNVLQAASSAYYPAFQRWV